MAKPELKLYKKTTLQQIDGEVFRSVVPKDIVKSKRWKKGIKIYWTIDSKGRVILDSKKPK